MPTRLYLRNDQFHVDAGTMPLGEQSTTMPLGTASLNSGADVERLALAPGRGFLNRFLTRSTLAQTAPQSLYFGRFISPPLAAQTIASQTWTISLGGLEGNTNANLFTRPVIYVWRPSTSTRVGFIYDGLGNIPNVEWGTAQASIFGTLTSASVTVQAGDLLVFEVWGYSATQGMATAYINYIAFNGTQEATANATAQSASASYIQSANDLTWETGKVSRVPYATPALGTNLEAVIVSANSYVTTSGFRYKGQVRSTFSASFIEDVPHLVWCCPDASNYYKFYVAKDGSWIFERNIADVKTTVRSGAAGSLPNFVVGRWYDFDIVHTPSGYISITWNSTLVVDAVQDTGRTSGNFGVFAHDCDVEFDNISSTEFASDFQSATVMSTGTAGTTLATNWITGSLASGIAGIRDSFAPPTPQTAAVLARPSDPSAGTNGNATPAGVSGTTALGTVTRSAGANRLATGVSASTAVGNPAESGTAHHAATGVSAATALGTAIASIFAAAAPAGVVSTSSAGSASAAGTASRNASGVAAASVLGTAAASVSRNVTATGVTSTASVGTASAQGPALASVVGQSSASSVGPATATGGTGVVNGTATPAGVSVASALGSTPASGPANATAPGVPATSAAGTAAVTRSANIAAVGVASMSALGTSASSVSRNITATGAAVASAPGAAAATGAATRLATGVAGASTLGTVAAGSFQAVAVTGLSAAALPGTALASGFANGMPAGVSATPAAGAATATGATVVNGTAVPSGVPATTAVGTPAGTGMANASVTGLTASAAIGAATATGGTVVNGNASATGQPMSSVPGPVQAAGPARANAVGMAALAAVGTATATGTVIVNGQASPAGVAANAAAASPEGRGAARISPAGASAGSALGTPQRTAGAAAVPAGLSGLLSLGTASAAGQIFIDGWALPAGLSMASALGRTDETVVFTNAPGGAGFPMRPDETMRLTDAGAARRAADWPARRPDAGRGRPREFTRTR